MNNYILIAILIGISATATSYEFKTVDFTGYYKWSPPGQSGNELNCPDSCIEEVDRCCSCQAKHCWEINTTACGMEIDQLHLEFIDVFGNAVVVAEPIPNITYYELVHPNGRLRNIPSNLCSWANQTVTIDLSNNRLTDVTLLKCMVILDTLLLDHNQITMIDNETFSNMENLRVLSLSNNSLQTLDSNALAIKHGNILTVDLSWNKFENVDITNVFRNGTFCSLSYEGSAVKTLTNELNMTVTDGVVFGPGDINLNKTHMPSFVNFSVLNIDYRDIGKFVKGRLWMDDSQIYCDCTLYELFEGASRSIFKIWGNLDVGSFVCKAPENMKGFNISEIYEGDNIERLVCDLAIDCPRFCKCMDTPSQDKVVVNCSSRGLTELPSDMPVGAWNNYKVDLLLDQNKIERIENRNYIHRLVNLDIRENKITTIDESFVTSMSDVLTLNIEQQVLTYLPRNAETKDPRNIVFGQNPILCNCDNVWVGGWMRRHDARDILACLVDGIVEDSAKITHDYLGCVIEETFLHPAIIVSLSIVLLSVLGLLIWTSYFYRYEILLLKRKYLTKHVKNGDMDYDVFLSFCEDNDYVYSWIRTFALEALQDAGYDVYCPWFSIIPNGNTRESIVANIVRKSTHSVICLCDQYQSDINSVMDFNIIWKNFLSDTSKKITVINFTPLRKRYIHDHRLRAFRKIRDDLSFKCTESKLFCRLKQRLGPPRQKRDTAQLGASDIRGDHKRVQNRNEMRETESIVNNGIVTPLHAIAKPVPVYERLHQRHTTCNCMYRKCYLYPEDLAPGDTSHKRVIRRPEYVCKGVREHAVNRSRNAGSAGVSRIKKPVDVGSETGTSRVLSYTSRSNEKTERNNVETSSTGSVVEESLTVLPNAVSDDSISTYTDTSEKSSYLETRFDVDSHISLYL